MWLFICARQHKRRYNYRTKLNVLMALWEKFILEVCISRSQCLRSKFQNTVLRPLKRCPSSVLPDSQPIKGESGGGWSLMETHTHTPTWAQSLLCLPYTQIIWSFSEDGGEKCTNPQWWLEQNTLAIDYIITTSSTKGPILPWNRGLLNIIMADRSRDTRLSFGECKDAQI